MKPIKPITTRLALALALSPLALLAACGGSSGSSSGSGGSFDVVEISNGFGLLLPHQVFKANADGTSSSELIPITKTSEIVDNVTTLNPILPPTSWPQNSVLPDGSGGNHFVSVRFTNPLDVRSVLSSSPSGQTNSGLTGSIVVLAIDPASGTSVPVKGRGFIGGRTFAGAPVGSPPELELQQWVAGDGSGNLSAQDVNGSTPGFGFPGTQNSPSFAGATELIRNDTFVFVVDSDGDLTTHDRFPANRQIIVRVTQAVRNNDGDNLSRQALGSSTVGPDGLRPEVATTPPPNSQLQVTPGDGQTNVDPATKIRLTFTEPVQPFSIGQLPTAGSFPNTSSFLSVTFGPQQTTTSVPFTIMPVSALDLSVWELTPGFAFPGAGPGALPCGTFNEVTISTNANQLVDLSGNQNQSLGTTSFFTGSGPGVVNAPVVPDAIYVSRLGATPSLSVLDLNGFGQSTGDPTISNFPNNPNLISGGSLVPPLFTGTCTIDGGSAGVFTLTKDSNLDDRLLRPPLITQIGEVMIGVALDTVFNNEPLIGCQGGGGNLCASRGFKVIQTAQQVTTNLVTPFQFSAGAVQSQPAIFGGANSVSFAPHPNPPPLSFPPLCQSPFIGGAEPTSFDHGGINPNTDPAANGAGFIKNQLVPGDPFGNPTLGIPPSGILSAVQNAFFTGPSTPAAAQNSPPTCQPYQVRQQLGNFLYVADPARREIVVLNSNRMTVLDRIPISDPTQMAMAPNLDFLAVTNQASDTVTFIDIDPGSSTFHQVIQSTRVGRSPRGIAWDPGNEDILVTNEGDNSVSVLSAFNLEVRQTVSNALSQPFDVVITQRQVNFGYSRVVYYAWILNRNGSLSIYESGPNGPNGWGFDDVVGTVPFTFTNPRKLAVDHLDLLGSVWVVHENPLDLAGNPTGTTGGAITNVFIESANFGQQPLATGAFGSTVSLRDLGFAVKTSIGQSRLTGVPIDIAFDNLINVGALSNLQNNFSAGFPEPGNGKSYVRRVVTVNNNNQAIGVNQPRFMFVAVPSSSEGPGVIDVISLEAGNPRIDVDVNTPGVQSVPAPGVAGLSDYFGQ